MALSPQPGDVCLIKTLRPRVLIPALAQQAQDNPCLLPSLPLTSHEQAQGYFMLPAKVQVGVGLEGKPDEGWPGGD